MCFLLVFSSKDIPDRSLCRQGYMMPSRLVGSSLLNPCQGLTKTNATGAHNLKCNTLGISNLLDLCLDFDFRVDFISKDPKGTYMIMVLAWRK